MKKPIPFGKYLLLERINVGGMAEVFMAKAFGAEGFERLLAIKKILPTMVEDDEFITMFLDEARISVQLNHPNVVQIHELGKQDENFYIAMDYVAGKDLRTILERYHRRNEIMPTAQAAYVAQRMAEGLDYAHKKKDARGMDLHIVHRDVSPQNILVSYDGEIKIIDFGIAKAANRAQKTQAGILKGKFGYMSPEQVRGLPIDRRSDIFALGVVFFEMLTGEKLFVGESDFSTLEKVRNAEVPNIRQLNAGIPAALEKVIYKSLAREVEDRYQWAGEMADDLRRILGPQGYAEPQMGQFMGEAFREDLMREKAKLDSFAELDAPEQPKPARSAPRPAPSHSRASMAAATAPIASRPSLPAARRGSVAPALDPVAAALAELEGGKPQAEKPRAAPRVVTPPQPAEPEGNGLDDGPTYFDPDNPFIPPPDADELANMDVSSDRTVMSAPAFEEAAQKLQTEAAKPKLNLDDAMGAGAELAKPERETILEDDMPGPSRPAPRPAPKKPTRAMRAPPPEPEPTRARPPEDTRDLPEPPQDEFGATAAFDEPRDDPAPEPTADFEPEPTRAAPSRRRKSAPARLPDPEPEEEPLAEEPPPVAPAPRPKIGLIVGGSAAGVVLCAGLIYAVYTVLVPSRATITVKVEPRSPDAVALVDNVRVPLDVPTPELDGEHVVTLRMPGQPDQIEKVSVSRGHPREIRFQIQDAPKPAAQAKPEPSPQPVAEQKPEPKPEPVAQKPEPKPQPVAPKPEPEPAVAQKAEPQPAAAESKTYSVRIESDPPGAVVLFGKHKDKAPLVVDGLDKNKSYTAEARLAGYKSPSVKVKYDGQDPLVVTVKLEKEAEKPAPEEKHEAAPKEKPEPKHAAARGSGTLICSSNPVAKVFVDGKNTNRYTPIPMSNPLKLAAGKHKIKFDDGSGKTATVEVTINPDETARLLGVTLQ